MAYLTEYPRPQLVRDSYISLNGEWEYAIRENDVFPVTMDGIINVPFSPETKISRVFKHVRPSDSLFYKLNLDFPEGFIKDKVILHFTAVDQIAEVYINENLVKKHIGGFLPFDVDIKPYINKENNVLLVKVKDYSDSSYYSRGKQRIKRGGIWYSIQSGIYMPVWMESVNNGYIKSIKYTPDVDNSSVIIEVDSESEEATIIFGDKEYITKCNNPFILKIDDPILWDIDNPYLYDIEIRTEDDDVKSYFAMRKVSTFVDDRGNKRFALNNKPYFVKGILDQGYWSDGFLTPKSEQDYINDIKMIKDMGFNTIRKHIKIESLRFYYQCDKLGILVWQDFVNGGSKYKLPTITLPLIFGNSIKDNKYSKFGRKDLIGRKEAEKEFKDTIYYLYNSPCIVLWTIFNEGWGQFDSKRIYEDLKKIDNTRMYDHASGWHDQGVSDLKSLHIYFKKIRMPKKKTIKDRIVCVTECGGYKYSIKGHTFSKKEFGYNNNKSRDGFIISYRDLIENQFIPLINKGMSGFIYTQVSDVEDELNGFITYDREVIKVEPKIIKEINDKCNI